MVKQSVQIYNHKRPHTSLKYKTPDEVHRASLEGLKSQFINPQIVNL
jgi:putative transposase